MAANGLRRIYGLRKRVGPDHLEGVLEHVAHEVEVEVARAAVGVGGLQVRIDALVAADEDPEAALEPEQGLDQTLGVVAVGGGVLRRAVDEGADARHLAVGALHGEAERFCRAGEEGAVELLQRSKIGVENRAVLYGDIQIIEAHASILLCKRFKFFQIHHTKKPRNLQEEFAKLQRDSAGTKKPSPLGKVAFGAPTRAE